MSHILFSHRDGELIQVSVIIPTFNRIKSLQKVLSALEKQSYPTNKLEVVVISDGSTDGTNEYLSSLEHIFLLKLVFQPNQGVAVARNNGVCQAEGGLVIFLDDDVVPSPDLVTEHVRMHQENGDNVVVIGPMLTPEGFRMSPWVLWEQEKLARQYEDMMEGKWQPTARQFYTGNTSLARRHLLESGGFDPSFKRAEDVELAYRLDELGIRFLFNPQAIGYHYAERSLSSWMGIPYAYGCNDVIFASRKGQSWLLEVIYAEFQERNPLIQSLTRVCLDRPWISRIVTQGLVSLIRLGARIPVNQVTSLACSGLFNLRYYQGVADSLEGREAFFAGLKNRSQMVYANSN